MMYHLECILVSPKTINYLDHVNGSTDTCATDNKILAFELLVINQHKYLN